MPGRLSWRPFFVLSALLLPIGGFQHPDGTMAEMLGHPAWVRSHLFMLAGFVALLGGLLVLRSKGRLPTATRRWTRLAVIGTTLQAVEMVLHTAAVVDQANLVQGNPTPVLTTHLTASVVFYPIFAALFIGLIVAAARERVVGTRGISWLGIVGLVAHGSAPPLVASGIEGAGLLFPLLTLFAAWLLLVALRRSGGVSDQAGDQSEVGA